MIYGRNYKIAQVHKGLDSPLQIIQTRLDKSLYYVMYQWQR